MKNIILTYPNKELFEKTRDIPKEDIRSETFSQIGSAMLEILRKKKGVGLSANQVGLPLNMCVIEVNVNDPKILLNPRVIKQSDKTEKSMEGCLSLPGTSCTVNRHSNVTVEYETVTGETETIEAEGLLSKCLQHEIDHLNGIMMVNRLNAYHKEKTLKNYFNFKKAMNGSKR